MFSLINFQDHPTNRNKKVFHFSIEEHALYFEALLIKNSLQFEKQIDEEGDQRIYYGVHIGDFEEAKKLNYLTIGNFRKPFIPDAFFRYFLIIISIIIVGLSIIGFILSN